MDGNLRRRGETILEAFVYVYDGARRLTSVTLRRKQGSAAWQDVLRAAYDYHSGSDSFGSEGDLRRVRKQVPTDSGWADSQITYYRYYVSGESKGFQHGLKFVVEPATYDRMLADAVDPLTASDGALALYADYEYQYDSVRRVKLERLSGGSRTYSFAYTPGTTSDDPNVWAMKTVETRPDGAQVVVYTNAVGQFLVKELRSGQDRWIEAWSYDAEHRELQHAHSSAVIGYDDTESDLAIQLRASDGLLDVTEYYVSTGSGAAKGYVSARKQRRGASGTSVLLRSLEYASFSAGGTTIYPVSKDTVYRNDDGTGAIETSYAFTYHAGTTAVKEQVTTLPVVPIDQNGSGVAAMRREYFDLDGRTTWTMNERGYLAHNVYDLATGAMTQQIADVDTSIVAGAPSGWTTPADGGLNVVTDYQHDLQGRIVQSLGSAHEIDLNGAATVVRRTAWALYDDVTHVFANASGYFVPVTSSYALVNPVSLVRMDATGKRLEQIEAVAPATSGTLAQIVSAAGGVASAFPQSSYVRWTTYQYTDCCMQASMRVYHKIPSTGVGSEGVNYDESRYGYDVLKRRNRSVTPGGTISFSVFDPRGLALATYTGTNDAGATESDPTGGEVDPANNMVVVTSNEYDDGDGNLTERTQHVTATEARVTVFGYDWRNRQTTTDGEIDFFEKRFYDNLGNVVRVERRNTTENGNLASLSETKFDNRGRIYRTIRYGVDPSTGTVGNGLTDDFWFDPMGLAIKSLPAGSKLFQKTVYDSLDRTIATYRGYDLDETSYAEAGSVADDVILEQSETTYDIASNATLAILRQRYHDAPAMQTGELKNPSQSPKARVTYSASYPDALGRTQASVDYGTNGGSALARRATIPGRSDTTLVTSILYGDAGNAVATTDPSGMVVRTEQDDAGRHVRQIKNYENGPIGSSSGACPDSDDTNVTVESTYNADGNVASVTAVNASTGNQTTEYVYGTTLADSEIASSLLLREEIYPDSASSSDVIRYEYDRQSARTKMTDQAGTVHDYDFDKLGRPTQDRATTLGPNIDGAVRRIGRTYEVRGMVQAVSSYDNAIVGSGSVVNDVLYVYDDFSQVEWLYQEASGTVNTSTSPKVGYEHADGSANTVRMETLIYPNGRELTYDYGSSGGMDDVLGRVKSLVDDDVSSTHLADYAYLGLGTFVECDYTEPDVKWTMLDLAGSDDPDTGDVYSGFDRFGRVKDNRWRDYGSSIDVDRLKYGYDRTSNRIWRENVVATSLGERLDEIYAHDGVHCLKEMQRGTLNSGKTAVTNETFAECWSLDATGNWSTYLQDDDGDATWDLIQSRTANAVNEIDGISETAGPAWATPDYDAAGNMSRIPQPSDPTLIYRASWDAWNRLVKLERSDGVGGWQPRQVNAFDGLKCRTLKRSYSTADGSLTETRRYLYSSRWQAIEEGVSGPSAFELERQYVYGQRYIDDVILRHRDTTLSGTFDERIYAMQDASWNVVALANPDGLVRQRFVYSPYGGVSLRNPDYLPFTGTSSLWSRLFASYELDLAVNLYAVRNRFYSSLLGCWVSRDPIGYRSGINAYEYVRNSPLTLSDPLGLFDVGVEFGGSAYFIVGGGVKVQVMLSNEPCCVNGSLGQKDVIDARIHGETGLGMGFEIDSPLGPLQIVSRAGTLNFDFGGECESSCHLRNGNKTPSGCCRMCFDQSTKYAPFPIANTSIGAGVGFEGEFTINGGYRICYNFPGCPEPGLAIGFCGSVTVDLHILIGPLFISGHFSPIQERCFPILGSAAMLDW